MIAAHHLDLAHNASTELPQYIDSLVFEVKGTGTFSVQFQHSADGTNWYQIGSALSSNSISVLDNDSEHIFLNVRAVISGTVTVCKVHFRRHKR
mgnify:CR=1 FL=1|tara:strand:+ start:1129 stop:1410 length:282 start_codon:yes stop_codon:yes gene_type:complete